MATEEKVVEEEWDAAAEGQFDADSYGTVSFDFHSAEADAEHESYFYFLLERTEEDETYEGMEIEMTKEQGIVLLRAMAKALGAKKMRIEVEF